MLRGPGRTTRGQSTLVCIMAGGHGLEQGLERLVALLERPMRITLQLSGG